MARGGGFSGGGGRGLSGGGRGLSGGGGSAGRGGGSVSRGGSSGGHHRSHHHHVHMPPVIFLGGRRYYGGGPGGGGSGGGKSNNTGCLIFFGVLLCLLVVFLIIAAVADSNSITKSTVKREPLPNGSVTVTGWYTDNLGWISSQSELTAGMKNFYNKTGVQPYLYLTDNIYGSTNPNDTQVEQFADALYEELFTDEAHVLLIFMEYAESKYRVWCYAGMQAGAVIDAEARDILLGYINKYYTYENLSNEAYFSKAFNDAANRIMKVTVSPWVGVFVVLGLLLIVILLFLWWNRSKAQKNLEAAQTEKILKTPLDTFGGEAAELAKKYEDKDKNKR